MHFSAEIRSDHCGRGSRQSEGAKFLAERRPSCPISRRSGFGYLSTTCISRRLRSWRVCGSPLPPVSVIASVVRASRLPRKLQLPGAFRSAEFPRHLLKILFAFQTHPVARWCETRFDFQQPRFPGAVQDSFIGPRLTPVSRSLPNLVGESPEGCDLLSSRGRLLLRCKESCHKTASAQPLYFCANRGFCVQIQQRTPAGFGGRQRRSEASLPVEIELDPQPRKFIYPPSRK